MKSEFEKARDEAKEIMVDKLGDEYFYGFKEGADWAYEWLQSKTHFDRAMINGAKAAIYREALDKIKGSIHLGHCKDKGDDVEIRCFICSKVHKALTKAEELEKGNEE